jgi:type I restriction enzyme M protein
LCKVKDEDRNADKELDFQWKEGEDDNTSFQVRLSDLYKKAMKEFLEKEITDLTDQEFESKYGELSSDIKIKLKEEFVKIRLQKNNEFAIKEVFDQESFEDNAIVLKEVVELLQNYKFRYNKKQPFLGEFFELLLNTGLKQESGQFFTPVPVARFICRSVPIRDITIQKLKKAETGELLPNIIDYSCGSGHFLTEGMEEVHNVICGLDSSKFTPNTRDELESWKIRQFKWADEYIYGIELDYRLVKTTKVGCYLHGDGIAKIIHGDGLDSFDAKSYQGKLKLQNHQAENPKFDFILSNPPYSVSSFKGNLKNKYVTKNHNSSNQKPFELYDQLTDNSSEIEALFIERTKQLLKDGGTAAIILPSSILSNTGIYTRCRSIMLKYFEIISITELGSNTFMATGTNTVILFLRRKNNYDWQNTNSNIAKFFETKIDITVSGITNLPSKYIQYVWEGIDLSDYITLLDNKSNPKILSSEIYQEYSKKLKVKNPSELQAKIIELEKEKMLYFALAYPQKVVLVKTGEKNEEKKFLGYEFSSRRGSEGIHAIQRGKSIDECTSLFDPDILDNPLKASTYIQQAFAGDYATPIGKSLQQNISRIDLVDMMSWDRSDFEKGINTRSKKKLKIESKWQIVKLGEVCEMYQPKTITSQEIRDQGEFKVFGANGVIGFYDKFNHEESEVLVTCRGATCGFINISEPKSWVTGNAMVVKPKNKKITKKYLEYILRNSDLSTTITGTAQPQITRTTLEVYPISLPPLDIQAQIVEEISKVEIEIQKVKDETESLKSEITTMIENTKGAEIELGQALALEYGKSLNEKDRIKGDYPVIGSNGIIGYHNSFITKKPAIIIGRKGSAGKVNYFEQNCFPIDTTYYVELKNESEFKFIYYKLLNLGLQELSKGAGVPGLNRNDVYSLKISLPPLDTQKLIVAQILEVEKQIATCQVVLDNASNAKKAILDKYLK